MASHRGFRISNWLQRHKNGIAPGAEIPLDRADKAFGLLMTLISNQCTSSKHEHAHIVPDSTTAGTGIS